MGDWWALLHSPPPHTLFRTHRPPPYPIPVPIGAVCGGARGCGGGEGEQSSSISCFLGNSGALSALKQIVHKSSSLYILFHSVIFNSVVLTFFWDHMVLEDNEWDCVRFYAGIGIFTWLTSFSQSHCSSHLCQCRSDPTFCSFVRTLPYKLSTLFWNISAVTVG